MSSDERSLVLVVEDNAELRDFIARTLEPAYRVQRADDGQAGWEQALAIGPDLIISDVLMPRMDGFALCRALKADVRTSHIPVLLADGQSNPGRSADRADRGSRRLSGKTLSCGRATTTRS